MSDYEAATRFLGEWGPFQQQVFALLSITVLTNGYSIMSSVFVVDTPAHRCLVPEHVNVSAAWRNVSIPEDQEGPGSCSRFQLRQLLGFSRRGLQPADVNLSAVPTEGCRDGWEYDRSVYASTVVSEWNLVCDDSWKKPLTISLFFCGVLLGSILSGQLSDRYGRKPVLFITLGIQAVATFVQVFSPSWVVFCLLNFTVGLGQISNYLTAFVLGTELLGPQGRQVFSTGGVCVFFALGYLMLPLLAFLLRDWRHLLAGLSVPSFLMLPLWWYIPESPRWLLSQGRVQEAEAIIREAARKNRVEPPHDIFGGVQKKHQSEQRKADICELLRSSNIRWISLTQWVIWINMTIAYFALSLNTSNLYGDVYLNCFLSAVVELPAYVLSWLLFRWLPRRMICFWTLFLGGVFIFLTQLVPEGQISVAITLEMMGKFAVASAFAILYAYLTELYPTVVRNTAVGACSMAARIGSIMAPYFIYLRSYSVSLPYILMGVLATLGGLLSLLVPETFGMPLPETITHMQQFPGCCRKTLYTLTRTAEEEEEHAKDRKSPQGS